VSSNVPSAFLASPRSLQFEGNGMNLQKGQTVLILGGQGAWGPWRYNSLAGEAPA